MEFKVLVTNVDSGPIGTLATAETENSRRVFWAIVSDTDGAKATGSSVGGVAEEEVA